MCHPEWRFAAVASNMTRAINALRGETMSRVNVRWGIGAASALLLLLTACASSRAVQSEGSNAMPGMDMSTDHSAWAAVATSVKPRTRQYFISADEVAWNYAPTGSNQITGRPFDHVADTYVKSGPDRIGSTYTKCLYRGYTDGSFSKHSRGLTHDGPLGLMGPVIHAQVGDTIVVHFRNECSFPASVHPHGVFYTKDSEGAPYNDGTSATDKADDAVAPHGGTHTYTWEVPERAGPGPMDGSSVMWMYHSHTDEVRDTYSGLMGPMVITAKGHARADGSPADVDREEFALFSVMDENKSYYIDQEEKALPQPPAHSEDDEEFEESNLMHSVDGYVFGNGPLFTVRKGEHVRWYVMSMGTEVDLHTPHWHGNTVLVNGMRMDTVSLLPAGMIVADMVPDDAGIWLFHCHVNDHITAGMIARYKVLS